MRHAWIALLALPAACVKPPPPAAPGVVKPPPPLAEPCPPPAGTPPTDACREQLGREKIKEANRLYGEGHHKEALAQLDEAAALAPNVPQLWLDRGYVCRQLLIPGVRSEANRGPAKCALDAFARYRELAPDDPRGEELTLQTLLDAGETDKLAGIYTDRVRRNPRDLGAINGLIHTYATANRLDDTLEWFVAKAELVQEPEVHDALGAYILAQLASRGGSEDKLTFDPRPSPQQPGWKKTPPPFAAGDLAGQVRVDLADLALKYVDKALAQRPAWALALGHKAALHRQRALAYLQDPALWQKDADKAEEWRKKAEAAEAAAH